MSMSALLSALRGAGRQHLTASTVAARQGVTGSHVLRIQDYTRVIRKTVPSGTAIDSAPFHVGGHDWRIMCYPNGDGKGEAAGQYTSLFLDIVDGTATARFDLSVLDHAGRLSCTQNSKVRLFDPGNYWGWGEFVKNDELDLVNDCLMVLCDVTVNPGPSTAVPEPTAAAEAASASSK